MRIRHNEVMVVNGRLKQVGLSFRTSNKRRIRSAVFLCDCGSRQIIRVVSVSSGVTRSCGCLKAEVACARSTTHGHSGNRGSREYISWTKLKQRCENKNSHKYPSYGGRGITVCERWSKSFEAFLEDMGPRPEGCSIERRDNNEGYSKDNCLWASRKEQQRNMRTNRLIEFNGKTQCQAAWCEELGISVNTLRSRLRAGWTVDRALTESVQPSKARAK